MVVKCKHTANEEKETVRCAFTNESPKMGFALRHRRLTSLAEKPFDGEEKEKTQVLSAWTMVENVVGSRFGEK